MQNPLSIGVDIGGTHITCAAVKIQEGQLLEETLSRATYDHEAPSEVILQSWAKALNPLLTTQKDLTMRFLNDATSFAVGEAWLGEGRGFQKVVVVTLGTGFGSAFVEDGVPVVSGDEVPKEGCLWHLPFKEGIADDYFSTRWFIGEYENLRGQKIFGVKELIERVSEVVRIMNTHKVVLSEFQNNRH